MNSEILKKASIVSDILDDYLDEFGPLFSFEIQLKEAPGDSSPRMRFDHIFINIKSSNWSNSKCPIVSNLEDYYREVLRRRGGPASNFLSSSELVDNLVNTINSTDPFQKIYKLTELKLSSFNQFYSNPDIIIVRSLKLSEDKTELKNELSVNKLIKSFKDWGYIYR